MQEVASSLTLICDGIEFKVNQEKMCSKSQIMKAAMSGSFKESTTKTIDIKDAAPIAVAKLVDYIDHGDYDDLKDATLCGGYNPERTLQGKQSHAAPDSVERMEVNAQVYFLVDRYDIPMLRITAQARFVAVVRGFWPGEDFIPILTLILDKTPSSDKDLRTTALQICLEHMEEILKDETWMDLFSTRGDVAAVIMANLYGIHKETKSEVRRKVEEVETQLWWMKNGEDFYERSLDDHYGPPEVPDRINHIKITIDYIEDLLRDQLLMD